MDEEKMSKSLGNVIDPFQVMDLYGVDALRFYLLREVSLGQDGSVSPEGFEARYTTELANEFGNLVNRTLAMIRRYRDGVIPKATAPVALAADLDELPLRVRERFDALDVSGALEEIWGAVRTLNRYLQDEQPWQLAKTPAEAPRLDQVLHAAAEGLRVVALVLHPYLPTATDHLLTALGEDERGLEQAQLGARPGGRAVAELAPLFPRVEPPAPAPARA
jgi:methionyl-tRNA synthetase